MYLAWPFLSLLAEDCKAKCFGIRTEDTSVGSIACSNELSSFPFFVCQVNYLVFVPELMEDWVKN